jgi:hypothetical protein
MFLKNVERSSRKRYSVNRKVKSPKHQSTEMKYVLFLDTTFDCEPPDTQCKYGNTVEPHALIIDAEEHQHKFPSNRVNLHQC